MRFLCFLLFMFSVFNGKAQEFKVVNAEGLAAPEINSLIKGWVSDKFRNAKNVIEIDEANKIIIKGTGNFSSPYKYGPHQESISGVISFKIDFEIKDDRFRYRVMDVIIETSGDRIEREDYKSYVDKENQSTMKAWQIQKKARINEVEARNKTVDMVNAIISSFELTIEQIPLENSDDEW